MECRSMLQASSMQLRIQPFMATQRQPRGGSAVHARLGLPNIPTCSLSCFPPSLRTDLAKQHTPTYVKPKLSYRGFATAALLGEGISTAKPELMADTNSPSSLPPPAISKSDAAFTSDGVEFVWGTEGLDCGELNDLFSRVGFPRRDPIRLAAALSNTYSTIWIRAARKSRMAKEGQLLGFARATSDGALSATIWDVAVHPAWQRIGLGRGLVERLTADLVKQGIATITLYAEPGVVGLYEKLGFVKDPQGVKGLAFQTTSKKARELMKGPPTPRPPVKA